MEATLTPVLAAALPFDLAQIPWSFVMAFVSLALIYFLFRKRADLFDDFGFSGKEVALLVLGSIAGWAVNVPLAVVGGTYLAVNVGGTLVPLVLIGWWIRKRKLRLVATAFGTAIVALAAWRIVEFHPDAGIVARYPYFFIPVVLALVYALVVSFKNPVTGVPVAYASGTLGALIGADLLNVSAIRAHFATAPESTIISIGGAGVFDMVFLAGTFAMALNLATLVALGTKATRKQGLAAYPGVPATVRDSRRAWESYLRLSHPNALDRAYAGVALSDLALRAGDFDRSVRMSWLSVDSLLSDEAVRARLEAAAPGVLREDAARLAAGSRASRADRRTLREAGDANSTAKLILGALAAETGLRHQLEGVS